MKKLLTIIFLLFVKTSFAQDMIYPGDKSIQSKWIKEDSYTMRWSRVKDTMHYEMGTMKNSTSVKDGKVYIVQQVTMKGATVPWIDTTIADNKTISPIYHSSRNTQRVMILNFNNKNITGLHQDNKQKKNDTVNDTVSGKYFDSNIYTSLLSWLPLKTGYTVKIPIYDYNSTEKHGIVYVNVNSVKEEKYTGPENTIEDVYVLDVLDGISETNCTYYIRKNDRGLLKIVIPLGSFSFEMERISSH